MSENRNIIADFLVRLGYDLDKTSEKEAEQGVTSLEEKFEKLSETIETVKESLIFVGVTAAAGKLLSVVSSTADKFDALGQVTQRIGGESAADIASLQYAAAQAGIEVDALNDGLLNFTEKVGEALQGEGEGLEVFKKLGVNIKDANGQARNTVDIFEEVNRKLADVDHATRVAYLGMLGFDGELVNLIGTNADSLAATRAEYEKIYENAGVDIDQAVKSSQEFNAALTFLKETAESIKSAIGARFLAEGTRALNDFRIYLVDNVNKIIPIIQGLIRIISSLAKAFIAVGKTALDVVMKIFEWWIETSSLFKTVAGLIAGITAAVYLMNTAFMKSPIGKLLALAAAVGMLIDDFRVWKEGGNSLIGMWVGAYSDIIAVTERFTAGMRGFFTGIQDFLVSVLLSLDNVSGALKPVAEFIQYVLTGILTGSGNLAQYLEDLFNGLFSGFLGNLDLLFGAVIGLAVALKFFSGPLNLVLNILKLFAPPILMILKLFGGVLKLIPLISAAVIKLGVAFLATPFVWITAGIAAVIAAGIALYKNWDTVSEFLRSAWETIKGTFSAGIDFLSEIFGLIPEIFAAAADAVFAPWQNVFNWFQDKFSWLATAVSGIADMADGVLDWFTGDENEEENEPQKAPGTAFSLRTPDGGVISAADAYMNMQNNLAAGAGLAAVGQPVALAGANITQNNNGNTVININESKTPQRTAEAIAEMQSSVQQASLRNIRRNLS